MAYCTVHHLTWRIIFLFTVYPHQKRVQISQVMSTQVFLKSFNTSVEHSMVDIKYYKFSSEFWIPSVKTSGRIVWFETL